MASRGTKVLIGCGIGCGALLLMVLIVSISFFVWINRRGELVEPEHLLGSETTGYVEWTLRLEDPGTEELVERLLETIEKSRNSASSPLPSGLSQFFAGIQNQRDRKNMKELFPVVVAWNMRPDEAAGDDLHLWTVSMETLGNKVVFADWLLGFVMSRTPDVEVVRHLEEKIYVPDNSPFVFFLRRSALFFATDLDSARVAVERLDLPAEREHGVSTTEVIFEELPADRALRGAITNRRGELSRLWEKITDGRGDVPWNDLVDMSFAGGFGDGASFVTSLVFTGPDEAWAVEHAPSLEQALRDTLDNPHVPVELERSAAGRSVRFELRVADLPGLVESGLQRTLQAGASSER